MNGPRVVRAALTYVLQEDMERVSRLLADFDARLTAADRQILDWVSAAYASGCAVERAELEKARDRIHTLRNRFLYGDDHGGK